MNIRGVILLIFLAIAGPGCSENNPSDSAPGGSTTGGSNAMESECVMLDEKACNAAADCSPSIGYDTGDFAEPGQFSGCYASGESAWLCGDALTCALTPSGTCLVFRNTCTPFGWKQQPSCSMQGCPNTNPGQGGGGVTADGGAGNGNSNATATCDDELEAAILLIGAASSCEVASECRLVLTESVTLSAELGNNESGYVVLREDADEKAVVEAARRLNECEAALGPAGVGLDESRVDCLQGNCAYSNL